MRLGSISLFVLCTLRGITLTRIVNATVNRFKCSAKHWFPFISYLHYFSLKNIFINICSNYSKRVSMYVRCCTK